MAGLIFFAVLAGWALIVFYGVRFAVQKVTNQRKQKVLRIVFVPVVFLLPVSDEIVGQFQFRALCSNEVVFVDEHNGKNTNIYLDDVSDQRLSRWPLKLVKQKWIYRDAKTHNILVSWNVIRAKGGWLSRFIGFPDGNPPYTFNGYCSPKGAFDFDFKKLNLNQISRDAVIKEK